MSHHLISLSPTLSPRAREKKERKETYQLKELTTSPRKR